jgi:hypothetical protein
MFKRTKGYLLLTLLVLTGLAGNTHSNSISGKERRSLVNQLKDSKATFLKSIKGLSEAQLNFKPAPDRWSIKECIFHLALAENDLWNLADAQLKQAPNPEKRSEIKMTDEMISKILVDRTNKVKTSASLEPDKGKWKTADQAIEEFTEKRADLVKYVKTTTVDVRNHIVQMPFGYLDSYQLMLMIAAHILRHTSQIEEVKADPGFPSQMK